MEGRLLLKSCSILSPQGVRGGMSVLVEGATVTKVASDEHLPALPGDWVVSCRGRMVAPGLIDCDARLVGGQLRDGELASVAEVEALTAHGMARALRSGVTAVLEQLLGPTDVAEALAAQARTADRLGVRAVVSHASRSPEHLEANAAFAQGLAASPVVRPALGFDARQAALLPRAAGLRRELGLGLHFTLGATLPDGLDGLGLEARDVAALHGDALGPAAERLGPSRTLLAVTSAAVGALSSRARRGDGEVLGLASQGRGTLRSELAALSSLSREGREGDAGEVLRALIVSGPCALLSELFQARAGLVEEGHLADLIVLDHIPLSGGGSELLELARAPVAWTIVGGRVVVREGQLLSADYLELAREASRALQGLRARGVAH